MNETRDQNSDQGASAGCTCPWDGDGNPVGGHRAGCPIGGDTLSVIARSLPVSYCPEHGPLGIALFTRIAACPHCGAEVEEVEYVPAADSRGAVSDLESAVRLLNDARTMILDTDDRRAWEAERARLRAVVGGQYEAPAALDEKEVTDA